VGQAVRTTTFTPTTYLTNVRLVGFAYEFVTSKVTLHVEEYGSGDPTVVLLHGFGGSARNFRPQARFLALRHHVVLFDARGHARSAAPEEQSEYAPDAFVNDVRDVVAKASSSRVVLGGISMGAGIALRYALAYPSSLAGLILASFPPGGDQSTAAWAVGLANAIESRGLDAAGSEFVWGGARFDADAAKWIRQGFLEHRPFALVATLRQVLAKQPAVVSMERELSALHVPTLVIVGEEDAPALPGSRDLARLIPHASLVLIPGAGHIANLQKPQLFNTVMNEFLCRIEA
jgi:pimeloyl-ACP methyl ester carboxylesterase